MSDTTLLLAETLVRVGPLICLQSGFFFKFQIKPGWMKLCEIKKYRMPVEDILRLRVILCTKYLWIVGIR